MSTDQWKHLSVAQLLAELSKRNITCGSRKRNRMVAKLVEFDSKLSKLSKSDSQAPRVKTKPSRRKVRRRNAAKRPKKAVESSPEAPESPKDPDVSVVANVSDNVSVNTSSLNQLFDRYMKVCEEEKKPKRPFYTEIASIPNSDLQLLCCGYMRQHLDEMGQNKTRPSDLSKLMAKMIFNPEINRLIQSSDGRFKFSESCLFHVNASRIVVNTMVRGYDFMLYCQQGDVEALKQIKQEFTYKWYGDSNNDSVANYFDINCKCVLFDGNSGLHLACYNGRLECVKYLISSFGCDVMIKNDISQQSILHSCSIAGHYDVLKYLLKLPATSDIIDNIKDAEVQVSARESGLKSVFADKIDVQDCHGTTPLQLAFAYANHQCVQLLLSYGADINHKSQGFKSGKEWVRQLAQEKVYACVAHGLNVFRATLLVLLMPDTFEKKDCKKSKRLTEGSSEEGKENDSVGYIEMQKDVLLEEEMGVLNDEEWVVTHEKQVGYLPLPIVDIILEYTFENDLMMQVSSAKKCENLKDYVEFYLTNNLASDRLLFHDVNVL